MLAKRIIPCLDVRDGVVVKGVQFKNHEVMGSIVDLAKRYADEGADELVFYDITASADRRRVDKSWVAKIAEVINIPFAVAGGIKTEEDAQQILAYGADKISINSPALADPSLITRLADRFGVQCVVVGIDTYYDEVSNTYQVKQYTGKTESTVTTKWQTLDWVKEVQKRGAGEIVLNMMNQDGMRNGYDLKQLQAVRKICKVPLIASGGAGTMEDFDNYVAPESFIVEFADSPSREVLENLTDNNGVEPLEDGSYRIFLKDDISITEKYIQESVRQNWNLKNIYVERASLDEIFAQLSGKAKNKKIRIDFVDRAFLDKMSESKRHQGIIAVSEEYSYATIEDIQQVAKQKGEKLFVLILDSIEDPHNLGSIIRVAECAGAHGIIIPSRRSASVNATVLRTSAGAANHIKVAMVGNINDAIRQLKDDFVNVYCADMQGTTLYDCRFGAQYGR